MPDLPVMLRVRGRRCVVVGGGPVALRRAQALHAAGALVTVIAPRIEPTLAALDVIRHQRPYQQGDLAGAILVIVATDDPELNARITAEAREAGCLVNRTDAPEAGDITVPAHAHHGPVTLAVHTEGVSATAAAAIRRELSSQLDPDWSALLEIAAPYRSRIQAMGLDPAERRRRLARLADSEAVETYKRHGRDALVQRYEILASP